MVNPNYFTEFGRDFKSGKYSKLRKETEEYRTLWQEQLERCINGYSVGGKWMSGKLYFYVNFGTIEKLHPNGFGKIRGLPELRDVEWEIDYHLMDCKLKKKGLMLIAGRRLGKSYFASGWLAHTIAIENQKGLVCAGDVDKKEEFMRMVLAHLNGLAPTELYKPILKGTFKDDVEFGYKVKDKVTKSYIEHRTGAILYGRSFRNNKTAANGTSSTGSVWEEVGMFDNLKEAYNAAKYTWMEGGINFGIPFLIGTGGDMDKGTRDAADMFEDPDTYNLKVFFDEQAPEKKTCLFFPGYYAFNDLRDENGVVNKEEGIKRIMDEREKLKKAKDLNNLYKSIQYLPLTWRDAFLKSSSNIFPGAIIQDQIEQIMMSPAKQKAGENGRLALHDGKPMFIVDTDARQLDYPISKAHSTEGCITIYEMPETYGQIKAKYKEQNMIAEVDGLEKIQYEYNYDDRDCPPRLYVAGIDPYAFDEAQTSVSVGSMFIYKRMLHPTLFTSDLIVAEYTGRPSTTTEFYENCRRLLMFYNAKGLYENNVRGLKEYFEKTPLGHWSNSLSLLAPTPHILKDIIADSKVDRTYGVHTSIQVKNYMVDLIRNWLVTVVAEGEQEGSIVYNVNKILSMGLLKELLSYDLENNFDRVIAFGLCLLKYEEDVKKVIDPSELAKRSTTANYFKSVLKHKLTQNNELNTNRTISIPRA